MMRMGAMPTNAYYSPKNLLHVLLDNNTHDSTGGQATISHHIDFVSLANSCGYETVVEVNTLEELESAVGQWSQELGLTFIYLKTAKGSKKDLGRPKIKPFEVKDRLMEFLNG